MTPQKEKHASLTAVRLEAYEKLFGSPPSKTFPPETLLKKPDERILIDVMVYGFETSMGTVEAAVTNGMSDQRMVDAKNPQRWARRELIQYFPRCRKEHARRLHGMAWLPFFDGFLLDTHHSVGKLVAVAAKSPWPNAFFLDSIVKRHREFECEVDGDKTTLLWHIPISDEEHAFKLKHGAGDLIDRMDAVKLPWLFDETNRPSLLK